MKIKVALAKYLAWVVLAILAGALAYAAIQVVRPETGFDKLKDEIGKSEKIVTKGMAETTAPPKLVPDYVGELKARFEHPPVLDRFRHNSFVGTTIVEWPQIQFVLNQTREVKLKGIRLTEPVPVPENFVKILDQKWDAPTDTSVVTFKAIKKGPGEAAFQFPTTDEQVSYLFTFSVLNFPRPPDPLPPVDVAIVPRAAKEVRGKTERALVLLVFFPDSRTSYYNVKTGLDDKVGPSNHADIYRKSANASDAEYVLLKQVAPAKASDLQMIWRRFYPEEEAIRDVAPPPRPYVGGDLPPVPEAAPIYAPARPPEPGRTAAGMARPQAGAFAYLDDAVDDGESYVYKIVTLNVQQGLETAPCKEPYISLPPVTVPSLVEFTILSAGIGRAKLTLTRLDPDSGRPVSWTGDFTVGMKIGGIVAGRLTRPPAVGNKDVDFSTGCILVDALGTYRDTTFARVTTSRTGTLVYSSKTLVKDPAILYLTPRGNALRLRSKSESAAGTAGPYPAAFPPRGVPFDRD